MGGRCAGENVKVKVSSAWVTLSGEVEDESWRSAPLPRPMKPERHASRGEHAVLRKDLYSRCRKGPSGIALSGAQNRGC